MPKYKFQSPLPAASPKWGGLCGLSRPTAEASVNGPLAHEELVPEGGVLRDATSALGGLYGRPCLKAYYSKNELL